MLLLFDVSRYFFHEQLEARFKKICTKKTFGTKKLFHHLLNIFIENYLNIEYQID